MNMDQGDGANPYAPPSSDVNANANLAPAEGELAERGTRFVSQLVDGLLFMVLLVPAILAGIQAGTFREGGSTALFRTFAAGGLALVSGVGWLALILFQAYLVTTTGQSIAKRLFKIKIVKLDGSAVNFVSGVLLRNWLLIILQQIPGLNIVLALADPLFIFRKDRRCIHDLIAGTKVIQLKGAAQIRVA